MVTIPENEEAEFKNISKISRQSSKPGPGRPPSKKVASLISLAQEEEKQKKEALKKQRQMEMEADYQQTF